MSAPPIENSVTLVESIMSDVRQAKWTRVPWDPKRSNATAVEGTGPSWKTVVVRWKMNGVYHYDAGSRALVRNTPVVVRIPHSDAELAWKLAEEQLTN